MPCYRVRVIHDTGTAAPVITAPNAQEAEQRAREVIRSMGRTPVAGGKVQRIHSGRLHE